MIRIRPSIPRKIWRANAIVRQWNQARSAATNPGGKLGRPGRPRTRDSYWNDEKLSITHKYPLSEAVADAIHPDDEVKTRRKKKTRNEHKVVVPGGVHVRAQIVNPELCDDVLKYVGHTLDKHKGCDILDINPGAGLWSRKLHEYLQPRSHVLLEQRHDKFKNFLDPLLTAPGSKYSLVNGDPTQLQTYRDLVTNGVFPHQTVLDADDPRAQKPNNTLLVTGSLVWDPRLPGLGFDSMAKQLAYHFASAAWTNDLFHAFGLIRTILWAQHDDYGSLIADSVSTFQKTTRLMEMLQNTNVFVTAERNPRFRGKGSSGRDPQYDIETTVRALNNGRKHGMELPPHRRDDIHDFAEDIQQISKGTGIISHSEMQTYLREQCLAGKNTIGLLPQSLIRHYENMKDITEKYPEIDLVPPPPPSPGIRPKRKSPPAGHPYAAQAKSFFKDIANHNLTRKHKFRASTVADIGEELYKLECLLLRTKDGPTCEWAEAKLAKLNSEWYEGVEGQNSNYSKAPAAEIDDRLAIRSPPSPLIQWDARPFEPLLMRKHEVWPQNRLSLLSAEPIPKPVGESSDFHEWVTDFLFGLFAQPQESLIHALDRMQHGLSDLTNECPSLKDPMKGGRMQLEHFRVRMLTNEMIIELARAYQTWPFKEPGSDNSTYFRHKHSAHTTHEHFSGQGRHMEGS